MMLIIVLGLLVLAFLVVTQRTTTSEPSPAFTRDAGRILEERFAKGDISGEEYLELKSMLK